MEQATHTRDRRNICEKPKLNNAWMDGFSRKFRRKKKYLKTIPIHFLGLYSNHGIMPGYIYIDICWGTKIQESTEESLERRVANQRGRPFGAGATAGSPEVVWIPVVVQVISKFLGVLTPVIS